jgi:general stress protein CsbA
MKGETIMNRIMHFPLMAVILFLAGMILLAGTVGILLVVIQNNNSIISEYSQNYTLLKKDYDRNQSLLESFRKRVNPTYFADKKAVQEWLSGQPGVVITPDNNLKYLEALQLQRRALEDGYYLSVSYGYYEDILVISCETFTKEGNVYYFDPEIRDVRWGGLTIEGGVYRDDTQY